MRKIIIIPAAAFVIGITACNGVPDDIIQPDEMAELMADIRVADAVVSINTREYQTRSAKEGLRKAVFDRHGVSSEQFDSALVWYGHHISLYQEVTNQSIEILEQRMNDLGSSSVAQAISVAGDSVDIWDAPVSYVITSRSPSNYLTFNFDTDKNWQSGDILIWQLKFVVPPATAKWTITAVYDDGAIETITQQPTVSNSGIQQLSFITDSTRETRNVSGWLYVQPDGLKPVVLDSISISRGRSFTGNTGTKYLQRLVQPRKEKSETANDSTDTEKQG